MKKFFCILNFLSLILFIQLALINTVHADMDKIDHEVKAGVFNFEGYHTKNENGGLFGYGIDLLKMLSEYSHLNFIFTGYDESWQKMQQMLLDGEIDVVSSARRSPEREKLFAFSLPVGRNHTILSRQLHNTKLRAGDYATYNNMKIGVISGSSQNKHLNKFANEKGFNYTMVEYDSPIDMANALQSGEVDAILSSTLRKQENETVLDVVHSDNFYMITRKEDQALIDEINYAIEQMNQNEGDWQNDLFYRYYGPASSRIPEFSEREKEFIGEFVNKRKPLAVTASSSNAPYSYLENGTLQGILPEYFKKLMEFAGIPFVFVANESPDTQKNAESDSQIDVVLDQLYPIPTEENMPLEGLTTDSYLVTSLARVTRRDFSGALTSVALPDNIPVPISPELLHNKDIKYYPSAQAALKAVEDREADEAYVLPYTAQMYLNRNPHSGLFYTMVMDSVTNFRMFVPGAGNHEIITILNKAIKSLPRGILNQLGNDYVSYNVEEVSLLHYLYANPQTMFASAFAIMLALSLLCVMWLRGKWNRRLLAATETANHELAGQLAIVEALSRDYSNVLAINPEKETAGLIKITGFDPGCDQANVRKNNDYKQLIETYIRQKVHPSDREHLRNALSLPVVMKKLAEYGEYNGTFRVMQGNEVQHFQFTFAQPTDTQVNNKNLILVGFRNIDDVIRKEQRQKKILKEALTQSRYANKAKTTFLNNMSHDIRTPMNAILGFTSLAASNLQNLPLVERYLGKIMTSGNHLLNLINDVLDMSRIESGKIKIEIQELKLPEILRDLRTIVIADAKNKNLDFNIYTENIQNEVIQCDKLRLNQILLNILSNAIKYTPAGGKVSLTVRQLSGAENEKATYEFRIKDTGIGMSEEFLKHVFEPFEREQTATVSGIQGTGLGLAITKNIVELLKGDIEVESKFGEGSEFIVTFNFTVKDNANQIKPILQFEGSRALIIDGDEEECKKLCAIMSILGFKPDCSRTGAEGEEKVRVANELEEAYEAYLINSSLPDMSGFEAVSQIRKIIQRDVPVFMLSASDSPETEARGKEAGVTEFISQPVFLSELRKALEMSEDSGDATSQGEEVEARFSGQSILLAEDNEMNQEIAQMILENAGFKLEIVENGKEAVEKIASQPEGTYDLVLMDVQMPVMNGYDATRTIRKMDSKRKAGIPIIAMTANAFEEDKEEARNAGMDGYVPKPIDIKQLMETLDKTLNKGAGTQQA